MIDFLIKKVAVLKFHYHIYVLIRNYVSLKFSRSPTRNFFTFSRLFRCSSSHKLTQKYEVVSDFNEGFRNCNPVGLNTFFSANFSFFLFLFIKSKPGKMVEDGSTQQNCPRIHESAFR